MIKVKAVDHINFFAKDLRETEQFYYDIFGFEVKKDQPEDNSKIIGNDNIKLCVYENREKTVRGGINHFGFNVENFDEIVDLCKKHNVEMPYGVMEWEHSRSVYIVDPNGYEIELSEVFGGGI